ncbi:MAG: hypothetical protein IJA98_07130 [Bacteroidaceae bacterium]|nr:hypothetical protein [Bacteroidaceae bacterium]
MKRIRLQLALMAVLLCTAKVSAHDFEVDGVYYNSTNGTTISTIDAWKSWLGYQDNGAVFSYGLSDTIVLGETTYFKRSGDSIYYRQDAQKVYRYNVNTATETLVFDFGLETDDKFHLYDDCEVVVESVSDTNVVNLIFSEEKYDNQRVLRLRGVEDASITDIWVEGIGSLHYGIERPTHAEDIKSQALAYCEVFESYNAKFLVDIGNVRGAGVDLGQEIDPGIIESIDPISNTDFLKFRLVNNTLHVGGYISCNCGMEIYLAAKDMGNSIELEMYELAPYADCYSLYAIDISFPEFTGEKYDVTFMGKKIATVEKERLTEITCREEGQLPSLLTDAIKREAQVLAISGPVSGADLKAINECKSLVELDLTNADIKVIPEYTWCHKLIEKIHLPMVIDTLNFNAILMDGTIEVVVPGKFPYLQNYPSNDDEDDEYTNYTDECWDYLQFVVPDDNLLLYCDTFGIYSADMKILYKCQHRALNDFESVLIDVEHVGPYAFMSTKAFETCNLIFSEKLEFIDCTALEGIVIDVLTGHWWEQKDIGAHISFLGTVPPRKNGLLRNHGNQEIAVSDVRDYMAAHSSWAVENITSFNGGNNAQDSYIGDYTMLASCDVEEGDNGFNNATFTIQVPTSSKLHLVDPHSGGSYEMDSPIDADTPITLTLTITDDKDTVLCSEKVHAFPGDTLTLSRVLTDIPAGTICTVTTQLTAYDAVLWSVKKTQDFAIDKEPKPYQEKFFADDTKWYGSIVEYYWGRPSRYNDLTYHIGADTITDKGFGQNLYRNDEYWGTLITKGEQVWLYPSEALLREGWYFYEFTEPFLLYDFSLQPNDTLFYTWDAVGFSRERPEDEYFQYMVVKNVFHTHGRKVIEFNEGYRWAEGIGCLGGPILNLWRPMTTNGDGITEEINRVEANGQVIYSNGEFVNPNIESWLKAGMEWTENKQYTKDGDIVTRKVTISEGDTPGFYKVSSNDSKYKLPFTRLQVTNNKVYGHGLGDVFLLYDFSLKVGDKIFLLKYYCYGIDKYTYEYDQCYVTKVDTVVYNGVPRKRIILSGEREDVWVEGIGSLTRVFPIDGVIDYEYYSENAFFSEVVECTYNGETLYHKSFISDAPKGYGIYHGDSYLYRYTIDESKEVTDSTDFARWYDKTVIYFDVDTIGSNAFSGATFRQGQILYFTERLNTIFKDAFTDVNIVPRTSQESLMSDDLTLVFAGANPPGIDKNHIMDYADSTYHINYVVPDLETYIKSDIQWTYTTLMTIDDFVQGYVSPENEVTVNDSTETNVSLQPGTNQDGNIDLVVHARPRKEIPVRIGEGENKDIYSRAPAWMRYTMELRITDSEGTELYTGEMQCSAYGECQFNVSFACPANKIIHIYSRSIDMFGRATEWAITTINLDTSISPTVAPNTDAPYYDLQGRPVAHPTRGIYIKDGKKVAIK